MHFAQIEAPTDFSSFLEPSVSHVYAYDYVFGREAGRYRWRQNQVKRVRFAGRDCVENGLLSATFDGAPLTPAKLMFHGEDQIVVRGLILIVV
jgi:hypothetical protein